MFAHTVIGIPIDAATGVSIPTTVKIHNKTFQFNIKQYACSYLWAYTVFNMSAAVASTLRHYSKVKGSKCKRRLNYQEKVPLGASIKFQVQVSEPVSVQM